MGAFTHASTDRPSRFSRGDYGVYYAGNSLETALYEHSFHIGRFFAATHEAAGWKSKVRQLVGAIDADLSDIRSGNWEAALDPEPENWGPAQTLAATLREEGSNGLVYPSVRHSTGECIAVFWPDVVTPATQADHYRYHWNGTRIDYVQRVTGDRQTFAMG